MSALGFAVVKGHKDIVNLLLESGQVNVDICDLTGKQVFLKLQKGMILK